MMLKSKKNVKYLISILLSLFFIMEVTALIRIEPKEEDNDNPYLYPEKVDVLQEDMREFIRNVQRPERKRGVYECCIKRVIDVILSFCGLIILSPLYIIVCSAVAIDDPGPVFFTQKRVGKNKKFFQLHKFRTMKMSAPHDTPTHMFENPEQYITRVGKFLRKSSLDELPQIWDIFRGRMSIIGPRPALWNQADLVLEREKYAANDVMPGLTGWAQINGRDELEIPIKAKLDGDYCRKVSFIFDCRCFIGTIKSVIKSEGMVEGGTGEINKHKS